MKIANYAIKYKIPHLGGENPFATAKIFIGPPNGQTAIEINVTLFHWGTDHTDILFYDLGENTEKVQVRWRFSPDKLDTIANHCMLKLFEIQELPDLQHLKCCQTCKHYKELAKNKTYVGWAFPGAECYRLLEDVFCLDSRACWEPSDA